MGNSIDFVVTWVDNNDSQWRISKDYYAEQYGVNIEMNSEARYRDWELMKYWFRSVEIHAPWVNKVYFITEGHIPEWLDLDCDKLVHVKHSDYIDPKYLPTFNSNVIELNMHNIESLSENFVSFNDDMFLNSNVLPSDFFVNGQPKDSGIFSPIVPYPNTIAPIVLNNLLIINKYFDSRTVMKKYYKKYFRLFYRKHLLKNICILPWKPILGFYDQHIPISFKKSLFKKVAVTESDTFLKTYNHRFRKEDEINHWLVRYWQLCTGQFIPRTTNFGAYYNLTDDNGEIIKDIKNRSHKVICINDGALIADFKKTKEELIKVFEEKYPNKSMFEK